MIMAKYTVEKKDGQGYVLVKDGEQSFCPHQQPIPAQGIGGMTLMRMPCSTNCPLAKYKENQYRVLCGSDLVSYEIENGSEDKPNLTIAL
jgi:hypothetical protein